MRRLCSQTGASGLESHLRQIPGSSEYAPDFHAIATESTIILPWDREILVDGELRPNPLYAAAIEAAG